MMAGSHVVVGVASWALVATAGNVSITVPAVAVAAIGSLLPDIDHPGSWFGRRVLLVSVPLSLIVGHRGVTHSFLALAGILLFALYAGLQSAAAPLLVGYLSHLAADACTPSGVPLLWPQKKTYSLNLFKTGSLAKYGFVGLLGFATLQLVQFVG